MASWELFPLFDKGRQHAQGVMSYIIVISHDEHDGG